MSLATVEQLTTISRKTWDVDYAQMLLDAATSEIQNYCGWHIAPSVTEALTVDGSAAVVQELPTRHMTALTVLTEDGETVDTLTVQWSEAGFLYRSYPWTRTLRGIVATITHGYTETPPWLVALVCDLVERASTIPTGVAREQSSGQSITYVTSGSQPVSGVTLLADDMRRLDRIRIVPRP